MSWNPPPHQIVMRFIYLFIYFWLRWVFLALRGFSLGAVIGGYSSLWCAGFSLRWLLLLWSTGSRHTGFSSCGMQASVVVAHGLWSTGLVVVAHGFCCSVDVGSSRPSARTRVPCIGRRILFFFFKDTNCTWTSVTFLKIFIYLFIFGSVGFSFLYEGFL